MPCYNIPVVDPDLRHEEMILQAVNVFEFLNQVIEDVFDRVNRRIESNRKRLEKIDLQIEQVNRDVARLKQTKEAIVIYSPCRYPGADLDHTIRPTFDDVDVGIRMKETEFALKDGPYVPSHSYQEKIQFYHVRSPIDRSRIFMFEANRQLVTNEKIKFVDSILLFNSKEFALEFGKESLDRSRSGKKTPGRIREEKILSSSSPIIRNRSRRKGQDIFYTPTLNDAPKMDVPVDLPDLPGIVTNIQYAGNNTLIAPSLQLAAIADQLPEIEDLTVEATETIPAGAPIPEIYSLAQVPSGAVPPPPPPPMMMTTFTAQSTKTTTAAVPPPPPPPPPPPAPQLLLSSPDEGDGPKTTSTPEKPKTPTSSGGGGDAHFNLMEEIRKAGGAGNAGLRHQQTREGGRIDSTKPSKSGGSTGPQNFIDDLHSKLLMRRKGISGARENQDQQQPGNVIDRLSALIPPPPPKLEGASASESNDEDWD
ncbi:WASH complex subunit 1 [Uranotaenia lowii]|uniref:WASH complex subunit 1 n=1 Tax=Uranotaenia lowii TaxID=190385 RepID=UPI00247B2D6A|nr:WASH complex subunit 1 [Uranotaenia lowii]